MRNYQLYFGRTGEVKFEQVFAMLGEFNYQPRERRLSIVFHVWETTARFDAGEPPHQGLSRTFIVENSDFDNLRNANSAVFEQIEATVLALAGRGDGEHGLVSLSLSPTALSLVIVTNSLESDNADIFPRTGEEYQKLIDSNLELVRAVLTVAWGYALAADSWLATLQPVDAPTESKPQIPDVNAAATGEATKTKTR